MRKPHLPFLSKDVPDLRQVACQTAFSRFEGRKNLKMNSLKPAFPASDPMMRLIIAISIHAFGMTMGIINGSKYRK